MSKSFLQIILKYFVQKSARKNTKYSRNKTILKIGHHAKSSHASPCKILTLSQKFKFQKTCQNPFCKSLTLVLCKKQLEKTPNIREMRQVRKSAILQRKGYSLCKMVSLGQKLKMPKTCEKPFYKNIKFFLCKETREKTPNIKEMRQVWKSAILQRYSPCKGHSLCKMVSLGQKLKTPKT